jgi:hypothetical protein
MQETNMKQAARWKRYVPPKRLLISTGLHSVIPQKIKFSSVSKELSVEVPGTMKRKNKPPKPDTAN